MKRIFLTVFFCLISVKTFALDVTLVLNVIGNNQKPILNVKTNLPPKTILMISLVSPIDQGGNGYIGEASASVQPNQIANFGPFSDGNQRLSPGIYQVTVTTVMADFQPEEVQSFFGVNGEKLTGRLVSALPGTPERGASKTFQFKINPDGSIGNGDNTSAQSIKEPTNHNDTVQLKWNAPATLNGILESGEFENCCFNGVESKQRYIFLRLDKKISMEPYAEDEPAMKNVDVIQLGGAFPDFHNGQHIVVKCKELWAGRTGHYALPVYCYEPTAQIDESQKNKIENSAKKNDSIETSHRGYVLKPKELAVLNLMLKDDATTFARGGKTLIGHIVGASWVSAVQIANDYEANEVAADLKYYNKKLFVSGTVSNILSGFGNEPYLELAGANPYDISAIQVRFGNDIDIQKIAALRKGQQIHIVCNGGGIIMGSPILKSAVFADDYANKQLSDIKKQINNFLSGKETEPSIISKLAIGIIVMSRLLPNNSACLSGGEQCISEIKDLKNRNKNVLKNAIITVVNELKSDGIKVPSIKMFGIRVSSVL